MTFKDLKPGDELWLINGRMNSVFAANVVEIDGVDIVTTIPDKYDDLTFRFDRESGNARSGESFLVEPGDWRAQVLLDRKEHARLHEAVIQAASDLRREPVHAHIDNLRLVTSAWTTFIEEADPQALLSTSIHDYLALKGVASYGERLEKTGRA
jgi:hypothetical protein